MSQITQFSQNKLLAISETGWIGEDLEIDDFQYSESSDSSKQAAYTEMLLQAVEDLDMQCVIWWTVTDFDNLWLSQLAQDPIAKIWKDIGFYDENQASRKRCRIGMTGSVVNKGRR